MPCIRIDLCGQLSLLKERGASRFFVNREPDSPGVFVILGERKATGRKYAQAEGGLDFLDFGGVELEGSADGSRNVALLVFQRLTIVFYIGLRVVVCNIKIPVL